MMIDLNRPVTAEFLADVRFYFHYEPQRAGTLRLCDALEAAWTERDELRSLLKRAGMLLEYGDQSQEDYQAMRKLVGEMRECGIEW